MVVEGRDLLRIGSVCAAQGLGACLLWAGARVAIPADRAQRPEALRARALAALLAMLGLCWPQFWLAGPALAAGQVGGVVAIAAALFGVQSLAQRRFGTRPGWRARRLPLAIGASVAMAALVGVTIGWPRVLPGDRDWVQAGLIAAVFACAVARAKPAGSRRRDRAAGRRSPAAGVRGGRGLDPLTGLPTRETFEARLAAMSSECPASKRLALLFIDLDGFKPVNDTYGHSVGDDVLRIVGKRLESICRGADPVARIGGDEFLMLLSEVDTDDTAAAAARRVIETLRQTYVIGDREIGISCSIGIAFHRPTESLAKLVGQADAAMYAAKRGGGSDIAFYTSEMDVDAADNMQLARDLRKALVNEEFELFYQPKIDARTAKITAAEALVRWRHPTRGEVSPSVFIPIAERSGLMTELSNWVVEDACRQGRVWRDSGLRMRVAINLSPQQMRRDDMVDRIAASLKRHRIHPSLLTCEITESLAMEDTRATQETFRKLGELGAHLSIDDFGTGYSSLSYLRRLPARELKIDRSFIVDLETSADARAIVKAILSLAHALGLKVVAEGVENERQQQILTTMGCDELQGFLFARPMSARSLLIWALTDRSAQREVFTPSLFAETRQIQRTNAG